MRKTLCIICINLVILLLLLAVAECGIRLFMQHNMPFSERALTSLQYLPDSNFRLKLAPLQKILSGEGGHLTANVNYTIDASGFRSFYSEDSGNIASSDTAGSEKEFTFLGGSHVFDMYAYNCKDNAGYPSRASSFWPRISCANAGIPGTDTRDYASRIRYDLKKHSPGYIIIISEWNDLKWIHTFNEDDYKESLHKTIQPNSLVEKVNVWDRLLGWSAIYRKLRDRYWQKQLRAERGLLENVMETGSGKADIEAGYAHYRQNLLDIADACREIGAIPIFSLEGRLANVDMNPADSALIRFDFQPALVNLHDLQNAYARCDSIIFSVAKETKSILLNTEKLISGNRDNFKDCVHFSDQGSRNAAALYNDMLWQIENCE